MVVLMNRLNLIRESLVDFVRFDNKDESLNELKKASANIQKLFEEIASIRSVENINNKDIETLEIEIKEIKTWFHDSTTDKNYVHICDNLFDYMTLTCFMLKEEIQLKEKILECSSAYPDSEKIQDKMFSFMNLSR